MARCSSSRAWARTPQSSALRPAVRSRASWDPSRNRGGGPRYPRRRGGRCRALARPVRQILVRVARDAFTRGLHVAFAVSAIAVLGAAVLVAIQLRHLRPAAEPDAREPNGRKSHVA